MYRRLTAMSISNDIPNLDPEDYYILKNGYIVFTKAYHLKRGYCCYSNCKNCPYRK